MGKKELQVKYGEGMGGEKERGGSLGEQERERGRSTGVEGGEKVTGGGITER